MASKYEQCDARLLQWLAENREDVTTSRAIESLGIDDATTQRHVSRRFTALEDRGVLKCTLKGTTRVCTVELDPPPTLARKRWRQPSETPAPTSPQTSIPAADSEAFLAAGGVIEKLPSHWDRPTNCRGIGILVLDDLLASLD